MPPISGFVNFKVRDIHVISLPGALVISQVSPLDQVVINPLFIHTGRKTDWSSQTGGYSDIYMFVIYFQPSHKKPTHYVVLPVVNNAMDHHPLRLDAISVVFVLHQGILGIFGPSFLTLPDSVLVLCP